MDFSAALIQLKNDVPMKRNGWNGADMFIYHVPANSYPAMTDVAKNLIGENVPYGAYLAMKTAIGNVVPWLASQTDLLGDDWAPYEKPEGETPDNG